MNLLPRNPLHRLALPCVAACLAWFPLSARAQYGDYERPPINYSNTEVNDSVARLASKLATGEVTLKFDRNSGYLQSVLEELEIPLSSQTLVFSKTSMQLHRISPTRPRALYFSDDVYVGFCQQGEVLELAATDANQGATFYTLEQSESDAPRFVRDRGVCLSCHASSRTQDVPGYLVRSVFADASGRPRYGSGTFLTDQTSRFHDRWGGWYVTGTHGEMRHMGNSVCRGDEHTFDREPGANQLDLSNYFSSDTYLSPHSDIVALMVFEHQTQMHNAIASANYQTRLALHQCREMNKLLDRPADFLSESTVRRIDSAAERALKYLLMCEEFALTDPVVGSSLFAEEFSARGIQDSQGRSLRQFDLQTRMFKFPCSYLIHSPAFAALPDEVRHRIYARLHQILAGDDDSSEFDHLTPSMRRDIAQILRETLPEFNRFASGGLHSP